MSRFALAKLGDVASFVRGVTFKPTDVVEPGTPNTVACMRTKNVQAELDLSDVWHIDSSFVKRPEQFLHAGDLLISSANSWNLVGKCSWVPELDGRSTFGGFVSALRPDRAKVDPRYLYRFFSSARTQAVVRSYARQTTNISNLDLKRCAELPIPVPPLEEQRRIASILDHADTLCAKRREAIARLDELTRSIFIDMFGEALLGRSDCEWVTMGDLCNGNFRNGLSPSKTGSVDARVLTLSAVTGNEFDGNAYKVSKFPSKPPLDQSVDENDLLICRGNGNRSLVGRGFFPSTSINDITFPDTIIAARVDLGRVSKSYLESVWNSPLVRGQIEKSARTTNGTFKINQSALAAIRLPVPGHELQQVYAEHRRRILDQRRRHIESHHRMRLLFDSLQSRAFRGEL